MDVHRDVRVFKGLDELSPWTDATRRLQTARRLKDRPVSALDKMYAADALVSGDLVPGGSEELMRCPLCQAPLSRKERRLGPFVWGVDSLHYVTAHQIWPPELEELLSFTAPKRV